MANQNLLTYYQNYSEIEKDFYAPVSLLPNGKPIQTMYCFLGRVTPWTNDTTEVPQQTQRYLKSTYKDIFVMKKITTNDISPVIQRNDWESGFIYDAYADDADMYALDENGYLLYTFYVKNRYDQVFKCLWNANRASTGSIDEPFFQPGSYQTNNIFYGDDGYKWKYIYTIDIGRKNKFMDILWMPVPVTSNTPNPILSSAGTGSIDVINVIDGGDNYDTQNSIISIVITGDGTGANAAAVIDSNTQSLTYKQITGISVTNPGTNYTYATATAVVANTSLITATQGSGAILTAPVSPLGGHGFDPVTELGCSRIMITAEFNGAENGYIPTDIEYRQVGLIASPSARSTYPALANSAIYKAYTEVFVSAGFGLFNSSETVYQGTLTNQTYSGTVLSFDEGANLVKLINTQGTPTLSAPLVGASTGTVRTLLSNNSTDIIINSGHITYIENRDSIARSDDGTEQFKFVLGY
jgi:hypothetical protein